MLYGNRRSEFLIADQILFGRVAYLIAVVQLNGNTVLVCRRHTHTCLGTVKSTASKRKRHRSSCTPADAGDHADLSLLQTV